MARHEHLPIYKAALDMTVDFEKLVACFSRHHKYTLGTECGKAAERCVSRFCTSTTQPPVGYFLPSANMRRPATTAATPAQSGTFTDCFSLTESWSGPSFTALVSFVYEKPPKAKARTPTTIRIKPTSFVGFTGLLRLVGIGFLHENRCSTCCCARPMKAGAHGHLAKSGPVGGAGG